MAALSGLELTCFGPPTASLGGRAAPPEVLWTKHLALLVYLALSPGRRRSRDHLMGMFWGESTQDRARGALNETLRRLRSFLGPQRLLNDGTAVVLNDQGLDVDALRVLVAAERAPSDAVALMRGEFLEGFNVKRAHDLEEWMSQERRRYGALRVTALTGAGEQRLVEGRAGAAATYARQALESAPHSEVAISLLMRALDLAGDATAALAAYHEFAERLERETGERPSKNLTAVAERIRKGTGRPPATKDSPRQPPFVGRAAAHRDVFETVSLGLATGTRTVVISGAQGMGRSRLLAECVGRAVHDGARVARARQLESDHDARWSALRQLLHGGLAAAPGLAGAPRDALQVLAAIAPELAQRFPPREGHDVAEVGAALAAVLASVAEEAPLVLAVDDAHWADGPSLAALEAAVGSLERPGVVLAITVATDVGDPPRELRELQARVEHGLPGVAVRLRALSEDDVRELVAALAPWCDDAATRDRLSRRLAFETGGSPLLAVTLLRALERASRLRTDLTTWPPEGRTIESPLPITLGLVESAVQLRVRELDQTEIAVLSAATLVGVGLDLELIAAMVERTPAQVERALPALERRSLIAFDGSRYAFVAPLVADVVRGACLTRGERQRLTRRAAEALAQREDLDGRALRCDLLARLEPNAAALAFAIATLRAAREAGAERVARRVWAAADTIATTGGLDRQGLD